MIFDKTIETLSKTLDLSLLRHSIISENIANSETPGFKARRVHFEAALDQAIENYDNGVTNQISVTPKIDEDPLNEVGQDRNSVDMDREMAALTKNDVKYSAASDLIGKKFALLKYAIGEGNVR